MERLSTRDAGNLRLCILEKIIFKRLPPKLLWDIRNVSCSWIFPKSMVELLSCHGWVLFLLAQKKEQHHHRHHVSIKEHSGVPLGRNWLQVMAQLATNAMLWYLILISYFSFLFHKTSKIHFSDHCASLCSFTRKKHLMISSPTKHLSYWKIWILS